MSDIHEVIHEVADDARRNTLDEVIAWLELAGEHRTARSLRRAFDHQERGHVCAMVDSECPDCGARV